MFCLSLLGLGRLGEYITVTSLIFVEIALMPSLLEMITLSPLVLILFHLKKVRNIIGDCIEITLVRTSIYTLFGVNFLMNY